MKYYELQGGSLARETGGFLYYDGHDVWYSYNTKPFSKIGVSDLDIKEEVSEKYYWDTCKTDTKENYPHMNNKTCTVIEDMEDSYSSILSDDAFNDLLKQIYKG